jgi:hypothetical protein
VSSTFLYGANTTSKSASMCCASALRIAPSAPARITSPAPTWASVCEWLGRRFDTYVVDIRGRVLSEQGPNGTTPWKPAARTSSPSWRLSGNSAFLSSGVPWARASPRLSRPLFTQIWTGSSWSVRPSLVSGATPTLALEGPSRFDRYRSDRNRRRRHFRHGPRRASLER